MATSIALITYLFQSALLDWRKRLNITTIEMMMRPILETKFPTVTVCPSRDMPVDPFATMSKFLRPVKFQCSKGPDMVSSEDCKEANVITVKERTVLRRPVPKSCWMGPLDSTSCSRGSPGQSQR